MRKEAKRALTGVEYLCLKMFLNPGRSQRFYRRALEMYINPSSRNQPHEHVGHGGYFSRAYGGRYRDVLWEDRAPKTVVDHMPWMTRPMKPAVSQMHLTRRGITVAMRAAAKIGAGIEVVETPLSKMVPGDLGGIPIPPVAEAVANPIGFR